MPTWGHLFSDICKLLSSTLKFPHLTGEKFPKGIAIESRQETVCLMSEESDNFNTLKKTASMYGSKITGGLNLILQTCWASKNKF